MPKFENHWPLLPKALGLSLFSPQLMALTSISLRRLSHLLWHFPELQHPTLNFQQKMLGISYLLARPS